jgi:hypothetical protein
MHYQCKSPIIVTTFLIDVELRIGHSIVKVCGVDARQLDEVRKLNTMDALNNFLRQSLGHVVSINSVFSENLVKTSRKR